MKPTGVATFDAVEYKNGRKNQWRREVRKFLQKHLAPGPVLYLAGSQDLDRESLVSAGFKPADLIAVERNPSVVQHLRAAGATVIPGDLLAVLHAWPEHTPVAGVIADLQCGFGYYASDLATVLGGHPAYTTAVIVANLQRGRDPFGAKCLREGTYESPAASTSVSKLSRAKLFYFSWYYSRGDYEDALSELAAAPLLPEGLNWVITGDIEPSVRWFSSYKSTPVSPFFDSVGIASKGDSSRRARYWSDAVNRFLGSSDPMIGLQEEQENETECKRRIAAALAIRTQRLRGDLGGGRKRLLSSASLRCNEVINPSTTNHTSP